MNLIKLIRQIRQNETAMTWGLGGMFSIPSGLSLGMLYGPPVGIAVATALLALFLIQHSVRELVLMKRYQLAHMRMLGVHLERMQNQSDEQPTP